MILPAASAPNRVSMFVYLNWSIFSTYVFHLTTHHVRSSFEGSIVTRLFLRLRKMFYRTYAPSANPQSPSLYSTTIAWNTGSGYLDHVIEHDITGFFQDEEFAIMSIRDPGDAESFLPSLDVHISMGPMSPTSGRRFFREASVLPHRSRPTTAGSSRPRTGTSARQVQVIVGTRSQTGTGTRPQTGQSVLSARPQTGSSVTPAAALMD